MESNQIWHDHFTGTSYECGEAWQKKVKQHLARQLSHKIDDNDLQMSADRVAYFWKQEYYASLFPLRFGYGKELGWIKAPELLPRVERTRVDLDNYLGQRLRDFRLDGEALPPILPDPEKGQDGWLLIDRILVECSLINILLLTAGVDDEQRHAVRLAALTYPFQKELNESKQWENKLVEQACLILQEDQGYLPTTVLEEGQGNLSASVQQIVRNVRTRQGLDQYQVRLVIVGAQRIKKYVFDTPGLNEIRGGSTLLDQISFDLRDKEVRTEIGPEVVLRAAGSTLLFLAPATEKHDKWPQRLRQAFWLHTGATFPAAATLDVSVQDLLKKYKCTMNNLHDKLDTDRAQAKQPLYITLPFETRCELCQTRAAEGWDATPGSDDIARNRRPLCRVCKSKREVGKDERRGKVFDVLNDLGCRDRLKALGVKGQRVKDWMANDLEGLIPQSLVRHKQIGVVYGDGNNFGAIAIKLNDIALGLQWTARISETTRAAAALALGQATQKAANLHGWKPTEADIAGNPRPSLPLEKIPFQLLALGGDDISLFAWAPVAVHFAAEFTRLTDLEFRTMGKPCLACNPLTFSLGVLVTDSHTPVIKSVDFAEEVLLKWAKKAAKGNDQQPHLKEGTIAMLYAPTAESVPADLEVYRHQMYELNASKTLKLCMTLRPYTADELHNLLNVSTKLLKDGNSGRLQRLVGAFYGAEQNPLAGLLHYAYQRSRSDSKVWLNKLEKMLIDTVISATPEVYPVTLVKYPASRPAFGLPPKSNNQLPSQTWFSPLWDLLELVKILS